MNSNKYLINVSDHRKTNDATIILRTYSMVIACNYSSICEKICESLQKNRVMRKDFKAKCVWAL